MSHAIWTATSSCGCVSEDHEVNGADAYELHWMCSDKPQETPENSTRWHWDCNLCLEGSKEWRSHAVALEEAAEHWRQHS